MISIQKTDLYNSVVKELNYEYGNVYIFEGFVVSEINEEVLFSWENHAMEIVNDVTEFTGCRGEDLIYISHRIHSYSVLPNDWLKFFKQSYTLKGYGVVGYTNGSLMNTMIENLFFSKKIKRFTDINAAVQWATDKHLAEVEG